ncbi:MAG TPA: Fe-S cluster assembly protein SufD, partial [Chromatiales bacterium]|nr:Fe-S cluster assembly protein SufD [Chromatiales bacterium]
MSAVMEPGEHYCVDFERLRGKLPGARTPWVRRRREAALARFVERGFPTTRDEAWKYTDASAIARRVFAPAPAATLVPAPQALELFRIEGLDCHRLVFLDGRLAPELSDVGALPPGVIAGGLARILEEAPDSLEDRLGCCAGDEDNGFAVLNTAFMTDGIYLYLPAGVALDRPVHVLHLSTGAGDGAVIHTRNLVVAEAGSRAVLIETYAGL